MAESRTKNTSRNILFGVLNKVVMLLLPFVTRTITLYLLGASYLGIGTLFTSILSFLSLAELGLGSAIVYSMYRPIAENDVEKLSALLKYYRRLYRIIGGVILVLGTLLVPAVPFLIKGNPAVDINIYILYYIYLINSVISYFFAGYRQSLLSAYQRSDIKSNISTLVHLFVQFAQIAVLFLTKSFYAYAIIPIVGTLITNVSTAYITKIQYPEIKCRGTLDVETRRAIGKKLGGLIGTKLNSIVVHSADTIVISSFLGLVLTAQYGNYYYIMNAVCGFITVLFSSMTASIGDKIVKDSKEKVYDLFQNLQFVNFWIVGCCSVYFVCLYEPFMKLWVGEELRLGTAFAILMTLYFFVYEIQKTVLTFKDAAGLWHQDQVRPYVSMTLNVVSNLILVQFIGIYGIVVSTILSFLISVPWINKVLFNNLFHISGIRNIAKIVGMLLLTGAVAGVSFFLCSFCPDGVWGLVLRFLICSIVPNAIFIVLFARSAEFRFLKAKLFGFFKFRKKKGT